MVNSSFNQKFDMIHAHPLNTDRYSNDERNSYRISWKEQV